jgi:hypothetical protein
MINHAWVSCRTQEEHLEHNMIVQADTAFGGNTARDFSAIGLYMW